MNKMSKTNKVSVVLPAYNEEKSVGKLVREIKTLNNDFEVIVVDDGSSDNTFAVAQSAGAFVIKHPYNIGNGAAVKSGVRIANGDIVILMDADGQHSPKDIPKLLTSIDNFDMVVGTRTGRSNLSWYRSIGNKILIKVAEFLSGHKIPDLTSGFRAIRREKLRELLHLFPNRYSYPTTITLAILKSGYFIRYLPLDSINRRREGESKLQPIRDGIRFINIMLRIIMLFDPQKIFIPSSILFFTIGC
ncbi:MAG: glycosyltransferase family 2 protein, partial [Candidatus Omnitrophica bacterium]|nr:glycosyltransferase family 2 protein [Candidatus Omnitrophota bacterium]